MGDYNDAFMRNRDANVQARTKAQNRATVLQLKLIGQSHPTGLTTNLLKLFEPRPPLEYKPPLEKRKCPSYTGIAQFVSHFTEPGDPEYAPPVPEAETSAQRRARIHKLRLEKGATMAAEELQKYDPSKDSNVTGDPYKTLFVARLNYETTEHKIKREFESYGPIKRVRLITDKEANKPRGYGFIEYMHTRDMKNAYKQADGRKIDGRRVLVDVERGRTVANWRPRRLGGGLGSTRVGGEEVNLKSSGRDPQQMAAGHRLEESRARDDRHQDRDREKSRERGRERDREGEKSHERSYDRTRDRDLRDDRYHHRDRDRNRDRERERERERDRGRERGGDRARERDRDRERGRDFDGNREHDRGRLRERDMDREREYDRNTRDFERGSTRGRDSDYVHSEPKRDWAEPGEERDHGKPNQGHEWYDERGNYGHGHKYDNYENQQYEHDEREGKQLKREPEDEDHQPFEPMEPGEYKGQYNHAESDPHPHEKEKVERSLSGEYEY
uniref:U1 small nuclear ribonucleoprotein n=1 Tax=Anthurium amnicola TaxID=1678845 RepID=A0A1D1ZHQ9_9ARAE